jgi:predicted nucleic acid-binding protein
MAASRPRAIADAGALVALIERSEPDHEWASDQAKRILAPMLTCESALSEACFLLRSTEGGIESLWAMLVGGGLQLAFSLPAEMEPVRRLMMKYRDVGISLADACLVRMAELHPAHLVFTLDHHFRIYRRHRRRMLALLIPPAR